LVTIGYNQVKISKQIITKNHIIPCKRALVKSKINLPEPEK